PATYRFTNHLSLQRHIEGSRHFQGRIDLGHAVLVYRNGWSGGQSQPEEPPKLFNLVRTVLFGRRWMLAEHKAIDLVSLRVYGGYGRMISIKIKEREVVSLDLLSNVISHLRWIQRCSTTRGSQKQHAPLRTFTDGSNPMITGVEMVVAV